MEQITSKDNRWIKEYGKLALSKSYRAEKGQFVVEGTKLILEAFENGVNIEMVFVTESCIDKHMQELEKLFQTQKCFIITKELDSKLSQNKASQGIFAICSKINKNLDIETIYNGGQYAMLVGLQDSGNVGTVIRTAEAVGLDGIIATRSTCDFFSLKVIRGSMGSVFRMPLLVVENELDFIDDMSNNKVTTYACVVDSDALELTDVRFTQPFVLLIGNEGNGLSAEACAKCAQRITIKMHGNAESLNAGIAAGILMYEAAKQAGGKV